MESSFKNCTYCNTKMKKINLFLLKTKKTYECPHCRGIFKIQTDVNTKKYGLITVISSVLIILINTLLNNAMSILSVGLTISPFLIFYGLVPNLVHLKPIENKKHDKNI